jgi:hypothetical protein
MEHSHLLYPVIGTCIYLNYPKHLQLPKTFVKTFAIVHNALLAIFSGYTFAKCIGIFLSDGIVFQHHYYFKNPEFDRIMFYFYLSKYYEYIDTFLIYLNGKKPIFLQTFHHIGAVVCWHLWYYYKVDGVIIATTFNSLVHTVMYSYYISSLLKINLRFLKIYITSLQLIQFFVGNTLVIYNYAPPVETDFNYKLILFFFSYVSILIVLFGNFFYKTYFVRDMRTNKNINKKDK